MAQVLSFICDNCNTRTSSDPSKDGWFEGYSRVRGYTLYEWGAVVAGRQGASDLCSKTCALEAQSKALNLASRT